MYQSINVQHENMIARSGNANLLISCCLRKIPMSLRPVLATKQAGRSGRGREAGSEIHTYNGEKRKRHKQRDLT